MSQGKQMLPIDGSKRPTVAEARLLSKSDPNQLIRVSVYARRNPHPSAAAIRSAESMSSELPGKRKYLNDAEFNSAFGADGADLDAIAKWAEESGLKVIDKSIPRRTVEVEGTIDAIQRAFGVELNEYHHDTMGRFRGRTGDVHVPADLYGVIEGVFGLDTRRVGHPRIRRSRLGLTAAKKTRATRKDVASQFPGAFLPTEVAQLYEYPADHDGAGQNVAIFAFNGQPDPDPRGGYSLAALKTYFETVLGGKTPQITDVVVQGPGNDPGPDSQASGNQGDSTGEVMLDMCVVGSVAPGAHIYMYFTEFTSKGWLDAVHRAITDENNIGVISISYGNPEDDPQGAWSKMGVKVVSQAFEAAMAKGITICCASGDDGSSDQVARGAHVDFPASSPFVLGVGGTKLVATSSNPPQIQSETVWNETMLNEGAGGGGVSAVFARPAYQSGVGVPPSVNPPHRIGRGVPDVAAVADPETGVVVMHIDGKHLESIGGTSAAAPLWAALVARLNQGLNARSGFLNPVLYERFPKGVLRDITVGDNGAYSAGQGWDACTGLGCPRGRQLLAALSGQVAGAAAGG